MASDGGVTGALDIWGFGEEWRGCYGLGNKVR